MAFGTNLCRCSCLKIFLISHEFVNHVVSSVHTPHADDDSSPCMLHGSGYKFLFDFIIMEPFSIICPVDQQYHICRQYSSNKENGKIIVLGRRRWVLRRTLRQLRLHMPKIVMYDVPVDIPAIDTHSISDDKRHCQLHRKLAKSARCALSSGAIRRRSYGESQARDHIVGHRPNNSNSP